MMIPPAIALGIELRVFAENAGESADIAVTATGDFRNAEDLLRFANGVDVLTFDHEHVPQEALQRLVDAGVRVHPSPAALLHAQDKLVMRERMTGLGLPVPDWAAVASVAELDSFLATHGGRAVVKTARGGYDGKGVRVVRAGTDVADWFATGPLLAEVVVEFRRELAQVLARRPSGEIALWPLVESVQRDGVCAEVIAPAPDSTPEIRDAAADIATVIAEQLGVTGVLAVELFETEDGRLLVNELAMRPHNSGHWSIDGALTSQFEQHLRAVLDLPLGDTTMQKPWSVMVNLLGDVGDEALAACLFAEPTVKTHRYGKPARAGRKVGHVTAIGDDLDAVRASARSAAEYFVR